ncbi:olfactory receptor 5V1-like [Pelobates fuscus]|uniref:olfactory receptor 5V1-like n=1 Tax=Pelobates fuscus TaxID=191477 RepID=UPI002FE4792C
MLRYLRNCTVHADFQLLAFFGFTNIQYLLFSGILVMFIFAVLGNTLITTIVCLVSQLHTPMYFLLCNLSVQDIVYVCAILPKVLAITLTGDNRISYPDCITQMFFFTFCVGTEFFLLTTMAYDRYVAICVPLRYSLIMNRVVCVLLVTICWFVGILNSLTHALLISKLSFCFSQELDHFYCDLKTLIKLSSSDTTHIQILLSVECVFLGFLPFMLILASYACIISAILKIRTSTGRIRVFSSCSSHLTVVFLFYVTSLSFYVKPETGKSQEDKLVSLLYTAVVPMLNPLVYSLRNHDVLRAIKNFVGRDDLMSIS